MKRKITREIKDIAKVAENVRVLQSVTVVITGVHEEGLPPLPVLTQALLQRVAVLTARNVHKKDGADAVDAITVVNEDIIVIDVGTRGRDARTVGEIIDVAAILAMTVIVLDETAIVTPKTATVEIVTVVLATLITLTSKRTRVARQLLLVTRQRRRLTKTGLRSSGMVSSGYLGHSTRPSTIRCMSTSPQRLQRYRARTNRRIWKELPIVALL